MSSNQCGSNSPPIQGLPPTLGPKHVPLPINMNFLSLLHPSSSPQYDVIAMLVINHRDERAAVFLRQKFHCPPLEERSKILDAVCADGMTFIVHRAGNFLVQRFIDPTVSFYERRKVFDCMVGRVVTLATKCYGHHVILKALDSKEHIKLWLVGEMVNEAPQDSLKSRYGKQAWRKISQILWTLPTDPIIETAHKLLETSMRHPL